MKNNTHIDRRTNTDVQNEQAYLVNSITTITSQDNRTISTTRKKTKENGNKNIPPQCDTVKVK